MSPRGRSLFDDPMRAWEPNQPSPERMPEENASRGTDHGTSGPVLVAGPAVKGGLVGPHPNLADLDETGDPRFAVDFRDVYANVLRNWLNVDPTPILGDRDRDRVPGLFRVDSC